MENIFVEFLPPWIETGLQPAFYDKESGTVLQQTARMYARVNMLIRMFNKLSKNTKTTVENYINQFNELHDYVHDYFDNLDVQEEINNKLDDMNEDGTLGEIIVNYLTANGVLTYNTIAELAAAQSLVVGSHVRTFGYKRPGDGVYNLYIIREAESEEVTDGYNTITLSNSDGLVAERMAGEDYVIYLKTTDTLQDYLSLPDTKTIVFPENVTIGVNDALLVTSNTTIDLNGSTIFFNYARPASFPEVNWDETLGFVGFSADDTFTGYDGYRNITIQNGTIKGGCSCFIHNANVNLIGLNFIDIQSRHALQFAGCKNVRIENCTFNGTLHQSGVEASAECVNLDPCSYAGQPWMSSASVMYDLTPIKNFIFTNNVFNQSTTEGQLYGCGFGSHSIDDDQTLICDNLEITNNSFGTPFARAIGIGDYKNVTISNNTVEFSTTNGEHATYTYFVQVRGGLVNAVISNNTVRNVGQFIYTDSSSRARKNLLCESNYVYAIDIQGYSVFHFFHYIDVNVNNNTIDCKYRAMHSDAIWRGQEIIENSECQNVGFVGNHVTCRVGGDKLLRFQHTQGCKVISNDIEFTNANNMTWDYYAIEIETGTTNTVIMFNRCTDPKHLIRLTALSDKVMYNNAEFRLSNNAGTSQTGTLAASIEKFTKIILPIGDVNSTQFIEILPWTPTNRNRFYWGGDTSRTFKFPVVKTDGTVGSGSLTINNDETFTYSYTGNVSLRGIYAYD